MFWGIICHSDQTIAPYRMLYSHMKANEELLLANSKIPAISGHSLHKGTPREAFVRDFLESHLSSSLAIGTGEIIDHCSQPGDQRNQFDIVLYKRNYPKLDFGGGVNAFLAESVIATIEVKSTLDKAGIQQAVKAAHTAKQLRKSQDRAFLVGYVPPSILSFVVAYDGPAQMTTAYKWLRDTYMEQGLKEPQMPLEGRERIPSTALDGVFVLGKGFMNFDNSPHGFIAPEMRRERPETRWCIAQAERGSLMSLFLALTTASSCLDGAVLNPLPYLQNFRVESLELGF
ncbi:DUF6602 domain-containing protein [Comamonas thiooxydans]|uniref:DUF6602 domain-containing protein n=1 Tax=Comamonas thiooxydans TaxID=363952 RepID=UPI00341F7991